MACGLPSGTKRSKTKIKTNMKQIEITPEIARMLIALDAMAYTIKYS